MHIQRFKWLRNLMPHRHMLIVGGFTLRFQFMAKTLALQLIIIRQFNQALIPPDVKLLTCEITNLSAFSTHFNRILFRFKDSMEMNCFLSNNIRMLIKRWHNISKYYMFVMNNCSWNSNVWNVRCFCFSSILFSERFHCKQQVVGDTHELRCALHSQHKRNVCIKLNKLTRDVNLLQ